jgi:hypothetical protein
MVAPALATSTDQYNDGGESRHLYLSLPLRLEILEIPTVESAFSRVPLILLASLQPRARGATLGDDPQHRRLLLNVTHGHEVFENVAGEMNRSRLALPFSICWKIHGDRKRERK